MTTTQSCREKVTAEVPRCGKSACMGPQAARVHDTHAELDMRVASAWLHGDELAHVHCMHGCMHAHMHAHPARKAGVRGTQECSGGSACWLSLPRGADRRPPLSLSRHTPRGDDDN